METDARSDAPKALWSARALESHLAGNQAVLFSRSTNLYGILENNDTYQYVGGLNPATTVSNHGAAPEFYIHNLRKPGSESLVDVKTWSPMNSTDANGTRSGSRA